MSTWRDKVHETIGRLCREAYLKANTTKSGKRLKRHVPYAIPSIAQDLVDALGRDDEETCKAIMLWRLDP